MTLSNQPATGRYLHPGGAVAARIAATDWRETGFGAIGSWPAELTMTLNLVLASAPAMCLAWGADRLLLFNDAFVDLLGPMPGEPTGATALLGRPARTVEAVLGGGWLSGIDRAAAGETVAAEATPLARATGPAGFAFSPVRDDRGRIAGVLGIAIDTVARRDAEQQRERAEGLLRRSETRLRALVNASSDVVYRMSPDWLEMRQLDGRGFIADTEAPSIRWIEAYLFPEDRPRIWQTIQTAIDTKSVFALEHRVRRVDGSVGWTFSRAIPVTDADGEIVEWFGMAADVTERRVATEKLRASEAAYRSLVTAVDAGFCIFEVIFDGRSYPVDLRVLEVNPAFERHSGLRAEIGRTIREQLPILEPIWIEIYGRVARTRVPERFEDRSDALNRWFEVNAMPIGAPEQFRVAVLFTDISDRRRSEIALRDLNDSLERRIAETIAQRELLADIVERSDAYVEVISPDYRWLAINQAAADDFERCHGVRPHVGDSVLEILDDRPAALATVLAGWARALAGEEFTVSTELDRPPAGRQYFERRFNGLRDGDGRLIGGYQFVHDITARVIEQRRRLETEETLHQVQKLESIGQITGGVAHDFNNLLTPIFVALDVLERQATGERERQLIAGAARSADKARTLVQRLLSFARRQPLTPAAVDIGRLVSGMTELIASTMGPSIRVEVDVADGLPLALVDPNQLELALLNLAVNARDAMAAGGRLSITAGMRRIGAGVRLGAARTLLAPGRYLWLAVADDGTGMDAATLARAAEPFFSTKGVGKGTGLGLSMVEGLASQSNGAMTITSAPGAGTRIELCLPEATDPVVTDPAATPVTSAPARGTILLVDDEELVRQSVGMILAEHGCRVVEAASAEAALALLDGGLVIDAVITDQQMPGQTGSDLARLLKQRRPTLPILLISGYADAVTIEPGLARLAKPFRRDELLEALGRMLGPAPPSSNRPSRMAPWPMN